MEKNLFDRVPYRYYHDLRTSSELSYKTSSDSRVIEVPDEELRLLHVSHLMLITPPFTPFRKPISPTFTLTSVAAFMAMTHFNHRSDLLVPGLKERLEGCDLYLTMDMLDTRISSSFASGQIFEAMSRDHSLATPRPGSVVGSFTSTQTLPVAILTSADQIPHVGGIPAAHIFDNKDQYPTFARTVPTTDGYAAATLELLKHLDVSNVAWLYSLSEYGKSVFGFFQQMAAMANITVVSANYDATDPTDLLKALETIKASGFRYIVAVGESQDIAMQLEAASDMGIAGPGFQWITTSLTHKPVQFESNRTDLINAYHGLLSVELEIPASHRFFGSLMGSLNDPDFTSFFVDSHPESFIWDNYAFNETPPAIIRFAYTQYDAVMSVGISACETSSRSFTGLEHYDQLKKTTFRGASGDIEFDSTTGTRKVGSLKYAWTSFLIDDELSTNEMVAFSPHTPITIDFALDNPVVSNSPIVFTGNTTTPPAPLPPVGEVDQNLIPKGIIFFGWALAGVLVAVSLGFAAYTFWKRKTALIRASQPIFLGMLCCGTMIMASTIVPLSLQEPIPNEGLNIACMSVPWLFSLGFTTAFSALFTKAWRINKVVRNSVEMRRLQVHARDVIWPFVLLMVTNVAILTTWTFVAPLQWTRIFSSTDQYGRGAESYGTCSFAGGSSKIFLLLLAIFNGLAVVFANYQSYIGRNNPTDFNESAHVALSMASLLECFLIGGPILLLVGESPEADFSVKTILIFVSCCAILLPMFIPKFTKKKTGNTIDDMHRSMRRISTARNRRPQSGSASFQTTSRRLSGSRHSRRGSGKRDSAESQTSRSGAESSLVRKLRSSQGSNESGCEIFMEEHTATRRGSNASGDGLASSVQELMRNARRADSLVRRGSHVSNDSVGSHDGHRAARRGSNVSGDGLASSVQELMRNARRVDSLVRRESHVSNDSVASHDGHRAARRGSNVSGDGLASSVQELMRNARSSDVVRRGSQASGDSIAAAVVTMQRNARRTSVDVSMDVSVDTDSSFWA